MLPPLLSCHQSSSFQRLVGRDIIYIQVYHLFHVFLIVHSPDINLHAQFVSLFHPFRMFFECFIMIVYAISTLCLYPSQRNFLSYSFSFLPFCSSSFTSFCFNFSAPFNFSCSSFCRSISSSLILS